MQKRVTKVISKSIIKENKTIYDSISKIGRSIKAFGGTNENIDIEFVEFNVKLDKHEVNQIISEHLFRNGRFEAGESFCKDSGVKLAPDFKKRFKALDQILSDLNEKKIERAIKWVNEHETKLKISESDLPFLVHKVSFCHLLKKAHKIGEGEVQAEILSCLAQYACQNFGKFYSKFKIQIQKLMGSLAFVNELENTKYYDLICDVHWDHLTQSFVRDFCKIQGLSRESGLFMALKVGTLGIPKFQKFFKLMKGKEHLFDDINELPIDIALGSDFKFHSIFICPVSKEIATKDNPPMLLKCGHCITKQSFQNIIGGRGDSRPNRKVKCPTCPAEIKSSEAIELKIF